MHVGVKLGRFILVVGLQLVLSAPEQFSVLVDEYLDEAVGTGVVGVEHEDVVKGVGDYLLARRVPEDSGVERLALWLLLESEEQQR